MDLSKHKDSELLDVMLAIAEITNLDFERVCKYVPVLLFRDVLQVKYALMEHVEHVLLIPNVQQQIHKDHFATPVYVKVLNVPVLLFRDVLQDKYAFLVFVKFLSREPTY